MESRALLASALAGVLLAFAAAAQATVNINTAQQSELARTEGLDKYKAKAIIEYRAQNGPFTRIEELENVNGFDRDAVEKARPQLALTGHSYVPPLKPEAKKKAARAAAAPPKAP
jgi:competence protein ComEA